MSVSNMLYIVLAVFICLISNTALFAQTSARLRSEQIIIGGYKLKNPESTSMDELSEQMKQAKELGFDYLYMDIWGVPQGRILPKILEFADSINIDIALHLNSSLSLLRKPNIQGPGGRWLNVPAADGIVPFEGFGGVYGVGEEKWAQRWSDGTISFGGGWRGHPFPVPDFWSPCAIGEMRKSIKYIVANLETYSSAKYLSFDDEYRHNDELLYGGGLAIYSPWSKMVFSKLSNNVSVPQIERKPSGYISDGKDYFTPIRYTVDYKWYDFDNRSIDFHVKDKSILLKALGSKLKGFTTTGGFGGRSSIVMCRDYSAERNRPLLSGDFQYQLADSISQGSSARGTLLGWWGHNNRQFGKMYDNWILASSRQALLRGPDHIGFASIISLMSKKEQWRNNLSKAIGEIKRYGPFFKKISIETSRVGILFSNTTISYQQASISPIEDTTEKLYHTRTTEDVSGKKQNWRCEEHDDSVSRIAYPALCYAGVVPRVITERDVLDGVLDELDVLVLINHQYSETRLMREYEIFAQKGKLVIADTSSSVFPSKTLIINYDTTQWNKMIVTGKRMWWGQPERRLESYRLGQLYIVEFADHLQKVLRNKFPSDLQKDTVNPIVFFQARSAGCRYLIALNADTVDPHTASFRTPHTGPVYDLVENEFHKRSEESFTDRITLSPGGWKVWMLSPRAVSTIKALVLVRENPSVIRLQVWDDEGFPARGVIPFMVEVGDDKFYSVVEHGAGEIRIFKDLDPNQKVKVNLLGEAGIADWQLFEE